jgi:hypothetical protein
MVPVGSVDMMKVNVSERSAARNSVPGALTIVTQTALAGCRKQSVGISTVDHMDDTDFAGSIDREKTIPSLPLR